MCMGVCVCVCVCVCGGGGGCTRAVLDKVRGTILYFEVVAIVVLFDRVTKSRKNINIRPNTSYSWLKRLLI